MSTPAQTAAKRRYRERHREKIRTWNREYARRKASETQSVCVDCGGPCLGRSKRCQVCHCLNLATTQTGEAHGMWKGEAATYTAHHHWIKRWGTRTGVCQHCEQTPPETRDGRASTHWANVSREYRRVLDDWIELCPTCHKNHDLQQIRA